MENRSISEEQVRLYIIAELPEHRPRPNPTYPSGAKILSTDHVLRSPLHTAVALMLTHFSLRTAIAYLHSLGIVHRDIKVNYVEYLFQYVSFDRIIHQPENVLLDEHTFDVKLADLGLRYPILHPR